MRFVEVVLVVRQVAIDPLPRIVSNERILVATTGVPTLRLWWDVQSCWS